MQPSETRLMNASRTDQETGEYRPFSVLVYQIKPLGAHSLVWDLFVYQCVYQSVVHNFVASC